MTTEPATKPPQTVPYFKSPRVGVLSSLERAPKGHTPASALDFVRKGEQALGLGPPLIYVSTSITSGGYKRIKGLQTPDIIRANNQASGLLVGALVDSAGVIQADNVMVPTEIGPVIWPDGKPWKDTDFMTFYFGYASGLSAEATEQLHASISVPEYASILAVANDRSERDNDARWPAYRAFTDIALGKVSGLLRSGDAKTHPAFEVMLQLVDVGMSLGCRAEQRYADFFGLDLLVAAIDTERLSEGDPLGRELAALESIRATYGVTSSAVMPVAQTLNPKPTIL